MNAGDPRAAWRHATLLTLALIVYSNGVAIWAMRRGQVAERPYRWTNLLAFPLLVGLAVRGRGGGLRATLRAVGVQTAGWPGALVGGLGLGLLLAAPPLLFFAQPVVLDGPLEYDPIADLSPAAFRRRVFIEMPVTIALFEEVLFRGLLVEAWARAGSRRTAVAAGSATFAAWHCAVTLDSIRRTNIETATHRLPRPLRRHALPLALAGGMLTTAIAGALFSLLRERTRGSLLGPIVAHWLVDALMVAALHRGPPTGTPS